MNNKIVSIKRISAVFLAIVLVAGTIAIILPSFMTIETAQAQPYYDEMDNDYNSYGQDYGMDDNNDRKSYGKDNNYKPQKDSNSKKSVIINKLKCINNNININGNNAGNVSIGNKGQVPDAEEGYLGAYSSDNEGYYDGHSKKDKGFDCTINNNNINTNVAGDGGNVTDGNETDTCEDCFREFLNEEQIAVFISIFDTGIFATLDQVCLNLDLGQYSEEEVRSTLEQVLGAGQDERINNLIECLLKVGIVFAPEP
ncbi:MAG TPA: hypothetical protein VFM28_00960 [Nitrososphaeraceae archaeon]|nr:hypothetical protein [Nitrososphaeraceae archaeon]